MTAVRRLKQALREQGKSVRWLQRTLADQKVRGSSYRSVYNYLQGQTPPPVGFLRATADALKVRAAWLITGDGAPTEAAVRIETLIEPWEEMGTATGKRLQKARELLLKSIPRFEGLPRVVRAAFEDALVRYVEGGQTGNVTDQQLAKFAARLWELLRRPFRVRGFRRDLDPEKQSQYRNPAFTDYAVAMLHALTLAMQHPGSHTTTQKGDK